MKKESRKRTVLGFIAGLVLVLGFLAASVIKTNLYNHTHRSEIFHGSALMSGEGSEDKPVSVTAVPRSATWTKTIDPNNEGITTENFQAYTYDFTFSNHTKDEVETFSFTLTFGRDVYLASAWNGSIEFHQHRNGSEKTAMIPDLRDFDPDDYPLDFYTVDGEAFVAMKAGDYLVYQPSSAANAVEMPIGPMEGTTPGMILYVEVGQSIGASTLALDYTFHRLLTDEPLFTIAMIAAVVWLVVLIIYVITSLQIRQYNERHELDNKIIIESIETFTGFIDAKDPYTNGHSKRVATYTRQLAAELGYEGEALDRIYYIALLHDCGKIGVPDNILGKPGRLTDEEFQIIKSHTVRGGDILSSFKSLPNAGEGALYHHERFDGRGYPKGLAGEEIPLIARIICVADSFDAMNTNRVYRDKLTKEKILSEIEGNKGKQFDPKIADVMLRLIRENKISAG